MHADLASNGAQSGFDRRVLQPLVRLFQEGREEEKLGETSELKQREAHLHGATEASYCLTRPIRSVWTAS